MCSCTLFSVHGHAFVHLWWLAMGAMGAYPQHKSNMEDGRKSRSTVENLRIAPAQEPAHGPIQKKLISFHVSSNTKDGREGEVE